MRAAPGLYPVREISPPDTRAAFLVLAGPYGVDRDEDLPGAEEAFVDRVDNVLRPDGYRLAGAFPPESDSASGVVGFRLVRSNCWGDHLWIDDFVAAGIGSISEVMLLLHFLEEEARRLGVGQIHLDVIPAELAAGPKEVPKRTFADEVDDLAREIEGDGDHQRDEGRIDPNGPLGNRLTASEHGFLYVGQRHVLFVDEPPRDGGKGAATEKAFPPRRPLGRPFPPRRGH